MASEIVDSWMAVEAAGNDIFHAMFTAIRKDPDELDEKGESKTGAETTTISFKLDGLLRLKLAIERAIIKELGEARAATIGIGIETAKLPYVEVETWDLLRALQTARAQLRVSEGELVIGNCLASIGVLESDGTGPDTERAGQ